jgi:hypothetical protein
MNRVASFHSEPLIVRVSAVVPDYKRVRGRQRCRCREHTGTSASAATASRGPNPKKLISHPRSSRPMTLLLGAECPQRVESCH